MLKRFLIAGGILFGVLVLVGGVFGTRMYFMIQGFKSQKNIATVSEEAAKQETWQPNFVSVGNLDPVQGADIANQVAGNVTAINFDSGQDVEKGQLLVQLDDSNEEAQLEGFKAQEKLADLNAKRSHDIFSRHLIAQSDVDTADSNLKQAQANVANTEADIAKKTIRAPFAGHAGIRNVNLGQYLAVGTVVVTLQALDHMYASFTLPEQALPSVARGQKVQVTVAAYPNQNFDGQINAIDSKVDPASHTVRIQGLIANPQHLLRAGMFANVSVSAGKPIQFVTVPKSAVTYSLYGDAVFVVAPDPKNKDDKGNPQLTANQVFVKLGDEHGARVAVLEGVKTGDQVVTSGMQKLHSGSVITIDNSVTPDQAPAAGGQK
ncbi:MAG TPA: efflux RND transporter periplasmic adaptor subunit [Gammaproteobacteria bacterium]|jgi:membrane fusion protein (multidrug efflux system)|nr:efflux RND transporter periplasmic adaptor subunit [Gammaproteobacteria bacterium]